MTPGLLYSRVCWLHGMALSGILFFFYFYFFFA